MNNYIKPMVFIMQKNLLALSIKYTCILAVINLNLNYTKFELESIKKCCFHSIRGAKKNADKDSYELITTRRYSAKFRDAFSHEFENFNSIEEYKKEFCI